MDKHRRQPIHIGTSGWHYLHWQPAFYSEGLAQDEFLNYYQQHFDTVEGNNFFYHLSSAEALDSWKNTVPADFRFAVKRSRYITHMKRLKDPCEPVQNTIEMREMLTGKTHA